MAEFSAAGSSAVEGAASTTSATSLLQLDHRHEAEAPAAFFEPLCCSGKASCKANDSEQQEQADVAEAILRSKADTRNSDGVVIVRLTSHSPRIKAHILKSPLLQSRLQHVQEAECEVDPEWANGALLLVPMTHQFLIEGKIELKPHNIVVLEREVELVKQCLADLPKRKRPTIKPEHEADRCDFKPGEEACEAATHVVFSEEVSGMEMPQAGNDAPIELVVEHTFLHYPLRPLELSESSTCVNSAPAAGGECREPTNPRRWKAP